MNSTRQSTLTKPEDMNRIRAWLGRWFAEPAELPISFVLDGDAVHGIPKRWRPTSRRRTIEANIRETVLEGTDSRTGLNVRVECTQYRDYPVVEWVAWLSNAGNEKTPVVSDVLALDGSFAGASPVLHHCNGDFYSADGYSLGETALRAEETLSFAPEGGRPCDGAFPYYRIAFAGCGLTMAIGWPGQWAASFRGLDGGVLVRAGQQKTNLRLEPGEAIRTPRVSVLAWTGDASRAVNLWRRWYLAHILPRPDGSPLRPLLACCGPGDGVEFTAATEENQVRCIELARQRGIDFDIWWVDAGWYPCYDENHQRNWPVTGTWKPDPERFPNGLKPVSAAAAGHGADLLLWFEPERVRSGTELETEHPEWLLRVAGEDNSLLNLGNPDCRQWLTEHVCRLIQDNGIGVYRQDFNFSPLRYWRENEAEDRHGMNENLHVQGYLRFWDDLLARNLGLWIDSCASGGRRNDLETMRRSVPLHYSDYGYGDHPVKLAFHRTLFQWIPYFKESTLSWDVGGRDRFDHRVDSFSYHCGMAPMLLATLDVRRDDYDYPLAGRMAHIWRRASDLILHGDFHPHTPPHRSAAEWVAWQFDRPETHAGFVQAIRLQEAPQQTLTVHPKAIQPKATYRLENPESGEVIEITGADLMGEGLTFDLPKRSGAIWFYHKFEARARTFGSDSFS